MKDHLTRGAALLTTAVTLVSTLLAAAPVASASTTFSDVNATTSYQQGIQWAYDHGIISGYGNGMFGPDNCVLRSELVKMIVNYAVGSTGGIGKQGSEPNFSDVRDTDWFYGYVKEAKFRNYIQGYPDGSFHPNACVNRAEAMKIAYGAFLTNQTWDSSGNPVMYDDKVVTDISVYAWYAPYARAMFKNRLVGTDHTVFDPSASANYRAIQFFPSGSMTRKEVAEMLYRISSFTGGTPTPNPTPTVGTPALYTPANNTSYSNSQNMTVNFTWSVPTGASYYDLMVRLPQSSSYFVTQRATTNSSSYYFNILNSTQTYYWKVRAYASNGTSTDSSEYIFQFKSMPTAAGKPVLTLPANGAVLDNTSTGVNFQFLPTTGVSNYQLALKMPGNSDFGWWDITNTSVNGSGYIGYYLARGTGAFLMYNGVYSWKIRAWNSDRTSYTDSDTWTMTYSGPNASSSIALLTPASGSNVTYGSIVDFQWQDSGLPVTGGLHAVQLSCTNTAYPSTDHWLEWGTTSNNEFFLPTSTSFTPNNTNGFNFNSDIYCHWRVVYYSVSGNSSTLNTVSTEVRNLIFKIGSTVLSAPILTSPTSGAVLSNFPRQTLFQWEPVFGASQYQLELGCNSCNGGTSYSNPLYYSTTGASMYQTMTGMNSFRFRVRAYDASGNPGNWSDYRYFSYSV